jgi:hypothetical protein
MAAVIAAAIARRTAGRRREYSDMKNLTSGITS